MFSVDPGSLFVSLIIGSVGFVFLAYGKKQQRIPHMFAGVALMVYPYFIDDWLWMTVVGAAIIGGLWWAVRAGY